MKGALFVTLLSAVAFPLKWLYARRAARRDPVSGESLSRTSFPLASGQDWPVAHGDPPGRKKTDDTHQ